MSEWEQENTTHMRRIFVGDGRTYCGQPYKVTEPDAEGMYLMCPDCIRISEELANTP